MSTTRSSCLSLSIWRAVAASWTSVFTTTVGWPCRAAVSRDDHGGACRLARFADDGDPGRGGSRAAQDRAEQGDDGQRRDEQEGEGSAGRGGTGPRSCERRRRRVGRSSSGLRGVAGRGRRRGGFSGEVQEGGLQVVRARSGPQVGGRSLRQDVPSRMKSNSSQRSASSITWLETRSVAPSAASRWKWSQNWTRSAGSTPTVGSSRKSTVGAVGQRARQRKAAPHAAG